MSSFLSIVLRQFVTKLYSRLPALFPPALHKTLSYLLFFLHYTNDCVGTDITPIIKYSDDSAMEDLSNSDFVYHTEVERFSNLCRDNSLDLNVKKTKEMLIDFRKAPRMTIPDLFIDSVKVKGVTEYKYLGTVLDNKLNLKTKQKTN